MSTTTRDADGDSEMDHVTTTTTSIGLPITRSAAASATQTLSPPIQTQTPPRNPTANANGKRPLNTISNGTDDDGEAGDRDETNEEIDDTINSDMDAQPTTTNAANNGASSGTTAAATAATGAAGTGGAGGASSSGRERHENDKSKTHAASGYTWTKAEDEPGYSWLSKKAMDESARAVEAALHRDCVIAGKYSDPFEVAEKEAAVQNSLAQR